MRHNVKGKKANKTLSFVVVKIADALKCIKDAELECPSEQAVRQIIRKLPDGTTDYKSAFLEQSTKVCCARVPRNALSDETLEKIDKCKTFGMYTCIHILYGF